MDKGPVAKLLWVDLEMTGLQPNTDRILEIAAIVTDLNYNELARYESIINPGVDIDPLLNDFSRAAHTENGLLGKIGSAPDDMSVQSEFINFITKHFEGPAILAGNSIHQDRRFIDFWWPKVAELLHYRMLDVSSFKILFESKYGELYKKGESHRALDDIRESITELQFYEQKMEVQK